MRLGDILDRVRSYHPTADIQLIERAYVYSAKVHAGQTRRSGEPYLRHPIEVTGILADLKLDVATVAVGLLHDTIEDTLATPEEIEDLFGKEIRFLVEGVTKISRIDFRSIEEKESENFRKMLLAMAQDIRVILVKLADRLHNMRTMQFMPPAKQKRIARETLDIYAPFANRLGIATIKCDLEDLAFRYLFKDKYKEIQSKMDIDRPNTLKLIEKVQDTVQERLRGFPIKARIEGRFKHYYSIYQKMEKKDIDLADVLDVIGLRIITNSVSDCYGALGVVHSIWTPIPGSFKDYIAMPKSNMYQSVHTRVMGSNGHPMEFQIRTAGMHLTAEKGIAAHWHYKEGVTTGGDRKFVWLQQMVQWQHELKDHRQFFQTIKSELFFDEVFVFTPLGEVKALPRGATPLDFASAIHSDVGNHCTGAKANGRIVPLRYQLRNGEIVEILTRKESHPGKSWLNLVVTSKARNAVRKWLRDQDRQRSLALGKEISKKDFKRNNLNYQKLEKEGSLEKTALKLGYDSLDDLLIRIGYGKISVKQFVRQLTDGKDTPGKEDRGIIQTIRNIVLKADQRVVVDGKEELLLHFAKCCSPVKGDNIIGFITKGRGVSVHQENCVNVNSLSVDSDRMVEVKWNYKSNETQPVGISIRSNNDVGLLANISKMIAKIKVNIQTVKIETGEDGLVHHFFLLQVKDLNQLNKVIKGIRQIKGVTNVSRIVSG
ncbi:MAG: RelA/SpoT family protein [bacterium]